MKESNQYDKIFKENIEAVTLALVEKVLGIAIAHYKKLPLELQRTIERKPDQLLKITDTKGDTFLLQLEFQLADEVGMISRMLEYRALLYRKYGLLVRQYVFFLGDTVPTMPVRLEQEELSFGFHLIRLSQIDYRLFLSSEKGDEVVFAVLGNFGDTETGQASSQIIERLKQTAIDKTELSRRLQQLRILANLRGLSPLIEQIMESILKYIREEDDLLFKKGVQQGKQEGLLEGEAKGIKQGKQEAMLRLLKAGILTTPQLASLFEVSEEFIEQLRQQLDQTR